MAVLHAPMQEMPLPHSRINCAGPIITATVPFYKDGLYWGSAVVPRCREVSLRRLLFVSVERSAGGLKIPLRA